MKLNIIFQRQIEVNKKRLEALLKNATELTKASAGDVSLIFISDQEIKKLNNYWRKKDQATDVLSFSYLDNDFPAPKKNTLGEIFISVNTAKKQAKEKNHDLQTEIEILFVHGVMHILGHTHDTDENYQKMHKLETMVLSSLK